MSDRITCVCQIISTCSIIANIYLIYVYYACSARKIQTYKHFFLATALQDVLFSACVFTLVPVIISSDHAFAFVGVGPLCEDTIGQALLLLFIILYVCTLLTVTNSFIYRYIHVCSSPGSALFKVYNSGKGVAVNFLINFFILLNWVMIVYVVFWPDPGLIMQLDIPMQELTECNIARSASLGISLKFSQITPLGICLLIEYIFLIMLMGIVMGYTAMMINSTLKQNTFSNSLRKMHGRMFTLLLVQTANPLIFLEIPSFLAYFYLFTGLSTPIEVLYITGILLALFPLMCPIIIVIFFTEYRKYTLNILRLKKDDGTPSKSTFVLNVKVIPRSPLTSSG